MFNRNACCLMPAFFCWLLFGDEAILKAAEIQSIQIIHNAKSFKPGSPASGLALGETGLIISTQAASAEYLSPGLANDFHFNAVGAHWLAEFERSGTLEVSLRVSEDGEHWGSWILIPPDEEPIAALTEDGRANPFAGETAGALAFVNPRSRYIQYRLKLQSSNPASVVIKRMSLNIINSADGPDVMATIKSRGSHNLTQNTTGIPKPFMFKRSQWGARPPKYAYTYTIAGHIAFHHTAGVSDYNVGSVDDCAARVRAIQVFHMDTNGWNDIGYNYAICRLGHIFQAREDDNDTNDVHGAHDGHNAGSMGVANLGYFHPPYNHKPTPQLLNALYRLLAWKCDERKINPLTASLYQAYGGVVSHIYGHREVRATACPGDTLFVLKQSIRDSVARIIAASQTSVTDRSGAQPASPSLLRSHPNPFSLSTAATITFELSKTEMVALRVYNSLGQMVRILQEGPMPAGRHQLLWNGADHQGRILPAGLYFYRLSTSKQSQQLKVLVVK